MKIYGFAPLLLALSSSATATKIRGSPSTKADDLYTLEVRKLAEEAREFNRELMGKGGYNAYDGGAGCNCAKDAVKDISGAHADAVQSVPMVTMAMLEKHKDEIWDLDTPYGYEPLGFYKIVTGIVEDMVKWANCILLQIDCNQCGVDGYPTPEHPIEDHPTNLPGDRKLYTASAHEGISNYDCCCDVNAIKKLVVDHINDFFLKALLNPGGAEFVAMNLETLFHSLIKAINLLAEPYADKFRYECDEPVFPTIAVPYSK